MDGVLRGSKQIPAAPRSRGPKHGTKTVGGTTEIGRSHHQRRPNFDVRIIMRDRAVAALGTALLQPSIRVHKVCQNSNRDTTVTHSIARS